MPDVLSTDGGLYLDSDGVLLSDHGHDNHAAMILQQVLAAVVSRSGALLMVEVPDEGEGEGVGGLPDELSGFWKDWRGEYLASSVD